LDSSSNEKVTCYPSLPKFSDARYNALALHNVANGVLLLVIVFLLYDMSEGRLKG